MATETDPAHVGNGVCNKAGSMTSLERGGDSVMVANRCEIVERTVGLFSTRVTLRSPLAAGVAWQRLQWTLPRFEVPPKFLFGPKPRRYAGSVRDNAFRLKGPLVHRRGPTLSVRGTIEPSGQDSLIHLDVYSVGANAATIVFGFMSLLSLVSGLIMGMGAWAIFKEAGGAIGFAIGIMFFFMPLLMAAFPIGGMVWARSASQRQLTFLLDYLQSLFAVEASQPPLAATSTIPPDSVAMPPPGAAQTE